jgi:hypothetical protein
MRAHGSMPDVTIHRIGALTLPDALTCCAQVRASCVSVARLLTRHTQAAETLLAVPAAELRTTDPRAFHVTLVYVVWWRCVLRARVMSAYDNTRRSGEGASDAGGPYREMLDTFCAELQSQVTSASGPGATTSATSAPAATSSASTATSSTTSATSATSSSSAAAAPRATGVRSPGGSVPMLLPCPNAQVCVYVCVQV